MDINKNVNTKLVRSIKMMIADDNLHNRGIIMKL